MSHNHATRSKRMKLTPEDDINGEKIIDNIRSMASSKDVAAKYNNFHTNSMYTELNPHIFLYILPQIVLLPYIIVVKRKW